MKTKELLFYSTMSLMVCGSFSACEKEPQDEVDYRKAMKMVEFGCPDTLTSLYFHGFLDGREICYSAGVDGYDAQAAYVTGYQTYSPSIDFNDPSTFHNAANWFQFGFVQPEMKDFVEHFTIECPVDSFGKSFIDLVNSHLRLGEIKLRSINDPAEVGFNIKIMIPYSAGSKDGFTNYEKVSATGNQDGSKFEITKLEKSENIFYYNFDIEAELNCKLYNTFTVVGNGEFFGEITDGKLVTRISVPK